jgi:tRNA-binding protein
MTISYDEFLAVDMRVGKITRVEDFEKARKPAYKLWIDFGSEIGTKQSSAQLTVKYSKTDLQDRLIVGVVNFAPKQIADFRSEVLVLGTEEEKDAVVLLDPGQSSTIGSRVF